MHEVNAVAAGSTPGRWLPEWARRRPPTSAGLAGSAPHPAKWILAASRLIFVFTILAIATMLVSAAIGFSLARQNDDQLSADQHAALRNAIAEFRSPELLSRFQASKTSNSSVIRTPAIGKCDQSWTPTAASPVFSPGINPIPGCV